jgi:type III secretory pathway component EscR
MKPSCNQIMTKDYRKIFNFQILFPIIVTLIAVGLKVAHIIAAPWYMIFIPVIISTPIGLFLLAFLFIMATYSKKGFNNSDNNSDAN